MDFKIFFVDFGVQGGPKIELSPPRQKFEGTGDQAQFLLKACWACTNKEISAEISTPHMPTLSANSDKGSRLLDSSVFRQKCLQNQRKQPKKCSRALFCSLLELAESVGVFSAEKSCRNFFICTGPVFNSKNKEFRSKIT
jgi:hypothetical protein